MRKGSLSHLQFQMMQILSQTKNSGGFAHFDPPFHLRTSNTLVHRGLVEVKNSDEFRLTEEGRRVLDEER